MVNPKEKLEEIESYLAARKRELADDIRFYIEQEEAGKLDEEGRCHQQAAESSILLLEKIGNTFFNWE